MSPCAVHLFMSEHSGERLEAWVKLGTREASLSVNSDFAPHVQHAVLDGLVMVERMNGFHRIRPPGQGPSDQRRWAERRKQALQRGGLYQVLAENVPNQIVGACEEPRKGSRIVGLYMKGDELVV